MVTAASGIGLGGGTPRKSSSFEVKDRGFKHKWTAHVFKELKVRDVRYRGGK